MRVLFIFPSTFSSKHVHIKILYDIHGEKEEWKEEPKKKKKKIWVLFNQLNELRAIYNSLGT